MDIYVKYHELYKGSYVPETEKIAKFDSRAMAYEFIKSEERKLSTTTLKSELLWYDEKEQICRNFSGENFFDVFEKPSASELAFNIDLHKESGKIPAFNFDQAELDYKTLYKEDLTNKTDSSSIDFLMDEYGYCFCERKGDQPTAEELEKRGAVLIITPNNFKIDLTPENKAKISEWQKEVKKTLPKKTSSDLKSKLHREVSSETSLKHQKKQTKRL